jgi:hypothetical protein
MVEVENAHRRLAAIDATRPRELLVCEPKIALLARHENARSLLPVGIRAPPSSSPSRPRAMAIDAHHLALGNLPEQARPRHAVGHQAAEVLALSANMIELQNDGISLTAVATWMGRLVGQNEFSAFLDPTLSRLRRTAGGAVPLEP